MMKRNTIYGKLAAIIVAASVMSFVGCTADDDNNGNGKDYDNLVPVIGTNSGMHIMTRAFASEEGPTPVWGFYEDLYPMSLENNPKIGVFVLDGNVKASFKANPAYFQYTVEKNSDGTYKRDERNHIIGEREGLNTPVQDNTTYNIYGFMSANNTTWDAEVEPNGSSYSNGAILKLKNVKTVTGTDVCAVVGVLKSNVGDKDDINKMESTIQDATGVGNFKYLAKKSDNFIYVWLDHLYSCVNFELNVDGKYSELRKIKLKKVEFTINDTPTTFDITVNLGNTGISSTSFSESGSPGQVTDVVYESTAGEELPVEGAAPMSIPGYFAPAGALSSQNIQVKFTYDVYQAKSKVITRQNATATNLIKINDLLTTAGLTLGQGQSFTIKALIKPTYLYVLADEDLDNPTVVIQ